MASESDEDERTVGSSGHHIPPSSPTPLSSASARGRRAAQPMTSPVRRRSPSSTRGPQSSPIRPRRWLSPIDLTEEAEPICPHRFLSPIDLTEDIDQPVIHTKFAKVMVFNVRIQLFFMTF